VPHLSCRSFSYTTELDLGANEIVALPECFGLLENLERLNLERNRLNCLPDSFLTLGKIKVLKVGAATNPSLSRERSGREERASASTTSSLARAERAGGAGERIKNVLSGASGAGRRSGRAHQPPPLWRERSEQEVRASASTTSFCCARSLALALLRSPRSRGA
jgi:Leucine-rich repeat (LRR) protein